MTVLLVAALALAAASCGGSTAASKTPTPPSATASSPAATTPPGTALAGATTTVRPQPTATDKAITPRVLALRPIALTPVEVPFGFRLAKDQAVSPTDITTADVGIPSLAQYFKSSDLEGGWATFYTREQPSSGLSSIVYQFSSPDSPPALVALLGNLTPADYAVATSVERVPSDKIGDAAQMMRYRIPGARILEYTWAQGDRAGQIVLRYSGDVESPDDVPQIVVLARKMAARMAPAP